MLKPSLTEDPDAASAAASGEKLGLTAGAVHVAVTRLRARCHDHKYDPVSSRDYYALYGILESSRFSFAGCEKNGQPRDLVPLLPQSEIDELTRAHLITRAGVIL